ncbi:hypothetical protein ABTB91_20165, partial [Acinetobacter baumannii]
IKIIGATTDKEVHLIEADNAFRQRFTRFHVPKMIDEEIFEVLQKTREHLLEKKGVFLDDEALRYILWISNQCRKSEEQPR